MFLCVYMFLALLRAHFSLPLPSARAKISLKRAKNIFTPKNVNSVVIVNMIPSYYWLWLFARKSLIWIYYRSFANPVLCVRYSLSCRRWVAFVIEMKAVFSRLWSVLGKLCRVRSAVVVVLIIFTQHSLLQMPSCHIMPQVKEKQLQAWEERLYVGSF